MDDAKGLHFQKRLFLFIIFDFEREKNNFYTPPPPPIKYFFSLMGAVEIKSYLFFKGELTPRPGQEKDITGPGQAVTHDKR